MNYLYVRNWNKWQTYRTDRGQPPWIKLHRRLLRNLDWIKLGNADRGALISIWMVAADEEGRIPDDPLIVARLGMMNEVPDLEALIEGGWLSKSRAAMGAKRTGKESAGDTATAEGRQPDAKPTPSRRHGGNHDANVTPSRRQHDAPEENRVEAEYSDTEESRRAGARDLALNGHVPDGLVGIIYRAFTGKGAQPILSESQTDHIRSLANRAALEPDPQDWTRRYLATAERLRQAGENVWKGQPWQPSAVCSEKMQARVIEAMEPRTIRHKAPPPRDELSPEERAASAAAATALRETIHRRSA